MIRYCWEGIVQILLRRNFSDIIGKGMIRYCWEGIVHILLGRNCSDMVRKEWIKICLQDMMVDESIRYLNPTNLQKKCFCFPTALPPIHYTAEYIY